MTLLFDEDSFEATAKAVIKFNPYLKGCSAAYIVRHMKRHAEEDKDRVGYTGTLGYILTFYGRGATRTVKATIDAFVLSEGLGI